MMKHIKDIAVLIGGFLTALMVFFSTLNIHYQWLTQESISSFTTLLIAGGGLLIGIVSVVKNTYVTKKRQKQKETLKKAGLK